MASYSKEDLREALDKWGNQKPRHPIESRRLVAIHYSLSDRSLDDAAKMLCVSRSTIEKDLRDVAASGSIAYIERRGAENKRSERDIIIEIIKSQEQWSMDELREAIQDKCVQVSDTLIYDCIEEAGYNFLKLSRIIYGSDHDKFAE